MYRLLVTTLANQALGKKEAADSALAALVDDYTDEAAVEIASAFAWAGDADRAFEWLDRQVAAKGDVLGIKTDPILVRLRGDPRWDELLGRLGLADEQLSEARL